MIKLKSLFRRGQTPSQSSSKHSSSSNSSNNNRNKSQSTQSLNTAIENEDKKQQAGAGATSTKFYPDAQNPPIVQIEGSSSERGVDVGDDRLNNSYHSLEANQLAQANAGAIAAGQHAHTLPHKKSKGGTSKKGQKQPKPLPVAPKGTAPTVVAPPPGVGGDVVMSSMAAVAPGSQSSSVQPGSATSLSTSHSNPAISATTANAAGTSANDLYALNPAFMAAAAAASYQFINNEQQQILEASNIKMQELQSQLDRLARDKMLAESRVTELLPYQNEVTKLKSDLVKMQSAQEKHQLEITNLKYENESLRTRLRDVVNSPLSDAEKHQIIQDSQRLHSSAPASIALPTSSDNDNGGTPCLTPDWDKHSSSSEISVACLQDKIIQMEETHYSTNEELQATLQELSDLQAQLSDAQTENERLAEEKDVLFQSLCRQTEKLNDSRTQINNLQELLLRDAKQNTAEEAVSSEREKKLMDLIKTAQDEREAALVKQEELNAELQDLRQTNESYTAEQTRLRERIALLESSIDAEHSQRKQMELQLQAAKEEISHGIIEINRLTTLLENAKSKIEELEQDLARGDKTDLSDLLDAARKEKDLLEEKVAEIQDQWSRSQAEVRRLKDQIADLTEELKVSKNNSKCALSHLEYRLDQVQQEKDKLSAEHQQLCESTSELQVQCKCHLEDKNQLQSLLSETQKHLADVERKLNDTQQQLEDLQQLRKQEAEEWQQFQSDLLMTVRVANDFKTEALSAREQLVLDNKTQKEKIRMLEQQIEKLNKQQQQQTETQQSVYNTVSTVQQEMASRRSKVGSFSRQDSRLSVKTLIESIENNKQTAKAEEPESRYSSSSSLNSSSTPEITPSAIPLVTTNTNNPDWSENVSRLTPLIGSLNTATTAAAPNNITTPMVPALTTATTKGPLREQQQQQSVVSNLHISSLNNVSKSLLSGERKDPLNMLAKNGGSKRNALLKWCQNKTVGYRNIEITNFSSSWNDGLAFCAILHSYLPDRIPYDTLSPANKRRNFSLAFAAAESVGIPTTLNINDMCQIERPDWTQIMSYVTAIYKYFET
ncbi:cytospin-A [Stomoxys calcitrans]|uniref:Calponin-homology (CH) domain-containing protein n=1 Tax=Stomoxys calcitrans TaxID=35570 RepID=A0A1I8Q320_STOCA|nr:cytospin-A [Stomoxys calcitrans]XP_013099892.1 cytospin-A [Stomoxys calcitrans]XP_013099893.1 cytospin-A [Stomoxys calcitrans]XP_013099894.1 cytospin-A [Stomoxys calcitrans]XP_059222582.1 cytospin-A [Stomoxys calcitrans]XP_059222583.1 cytospin-A [Stomoxys calcitrans]XP_059222584.1 cytospin-A [Stomoxys calcitrans]